MSSKYTSISSKMFYVQNAFKWIYWRGGPFKNNLCRLVLCDDLEQWDGRRGERLKRKEIQIQL